jgi:hypothetical protein
MKDINKIYQILVERLKELEEIGNTPKHIRYDNGDRTFPLSARIDEIQRLIIAVNKFIVKEEEIEEDKPILIGHLNKKFGYNGCKPIEVGSEVFELRDCYFFMVEPDKGKPYQCKFNKTTLRPCINFIE